MPLTVNFGFVLRGSAPCTERKSFVRINFENNVMPVPPPGIGNENFIFAYLFMFIAACGYIIYNKCDGTSLSFGLQVGTGFY